MDIYTVFRVMFVLLLKYNVEMKIKTTKKYYFPPTWMVLKWFKIWCIHTMENDWP